MKKTLKTTLTGIAVAAVLLSASSLPTVSPLIGDNSIVVSAAVTQKNISYSNAHGTWTFSVESDSNYSNATLTVTAFKPSNDKADIRIPSSVTVTFTDSSGVSRTLKDCKVTKIAKNAFSKSTINSVSICPNIECIEQQAFSNSKNLTTVKFASNTKMTEISFRAFYTCESLTTINIPDSVTKIDTAAFYQCSSLETVDLPDSLTTIGSSAFSFCSKLSDVNLGSCAKLSSIEGLAFSRTALKEVTLPSSITSVSNNSFSNCDNLTKTTFPAKDAALDIINDNITEITINGNINSITNFSSIREAYSLSKINGENIVVNGDLNPKFHMIYKDAVYGDNKYIDEMIKNKITTIVNTETKDCKNDFQKAKKLHDWICRKVSYDSADKKNPDNHTDYSVFLNDNTVCDGYARAYALLMQAAGIEAYYVTGNEEYSEEDKKDVTHAWNIVKLGNSYFHVDVCWDDDDNTIGYDCFLVPDSIIQNKKWHRETKIEYPSNLYNKYDGKKTVVCDVTIGDATGDGHAANDDYQLLYSYVTKGAQLNDNQIKALDLNFDGRTNLTDLTIYARYINSPTMDPLVTYL
ncbi:MAG: leucine-rich repeat protein [Oscillospiraceae bacterium]|nr:leucine-rich repeat protein [Oscillospiraceae bacterium]